MAKIFMTRQIPGPAKEMLESAGHSVLVSSDDRPLKPAELIKSLKADSFDAVVSLLYDEINASVFDASPSVKLYANYAVGFNNIDVSEAIRRGITVTNTPSDLVNESVAEHTFSLALSLAHRIVEGDQCVRSGNYTGWNPNLLIGFDLKGKTFGVIGAGRIGSFVVQKAVQGFGMKAVYFDVVRNEYIEREYGAVFLPSVDEVLRVSDVVTLHVLLNEKTHHLINAEKFSLMKPSSILINTSRGPVVDEKALISALSKKQIRGAAIDVFEFEPEVSSTLRGLSNVIMTPHIASATEAARADMSRIVAQNILDFFNNKRPPNVVTTVS